jgi:hypothetical protein
MKGFPAINLQMFQNALFVCIIQEMSVSGGEGVVL